MAYKAGDTRRLTVPNPSACWFDGTDCPYGEPEANFLARPSFCKIGTCRKLDGMVDNGIISFEGSISKEEALDLIEQKDIDGLLAEELKEILEEKLERVRNRIKTTSLCLWEILAEWLAENIEDLTERDEEEILIEAIDILRNYEDSGKRVLTEGGVYKIVEEDLSDLPNP